jgi:hypothetical protein
VGLPALQYKFKFPTSKHSFPRTPDMPGGYCLLHHQTQHTEIILNFPLCQTFNIHTPLPHPTPVITGDMLLDRLHRTQNCPLLHKDNNLYKIALEHGMILFLNTNSFLFSHIVQHTVPNRKNCTLLILSPPPGS